MIKASLKVHSYYSILQSPQHVSDIVDKAYSLGLDYLAITDYHSVSGIPELFQLVEKRNEKTDHKIIPIAGMSVLYNKCKRIYLLAKNHIGWKNLLHLVSLIRSNDKNTDFVLDIDKLSQYSTNLICISDMQDNDLHDLYEIFVINTDNPCYYENKEDKLYQQFLVASNNKLTLEECKTAELNDFDKRFFSEESFEMREQDFSNTEFLKTISTYSIFSAPKIPNFIDKDKIITSENADEYLTNLCRDGWKRLAITKKSSPENITNIYTERIKEELSVIKLAKIANYFLLVRDFVNYCRSHGQSAGLRGSAVGSLIFYLIGVTDIDPVKPDPSLPYDPDKSLLFSRFINKGRFAGGKFSLPDADIDIHPSFRGKLKEYIRAKYGNNNVCDIVTFSKMKGAKTIKEVFRVLGLSFELANQITKHMVDEAVVQDELEDLREDNPKYNIINYCIDNIPQVKNYYDEMKYEFDIAIKLNNTITNESKHAAGIIISSEPINNFIPTSIKDGNAIGLFKMQDIEYVGGVKMDILGVLAYEKLDNMIELINKKENK